MIHPERRDQERASVHQTNNCKVRHLNSGEVFRVEIVDLSLKGMRLKFLSAADINKVTEKPGNLQILESRMDKPTFKLPGRTMIVIWQEGEELGCSFVN